LSRFRSKGKERRERKAEQKASRRRQVPEFDVGWRKVPGDLRRWNQLIGAHRAALGRKLAVTGGTIIAAFVIGLLIAPLIVEFVILGRTPVARVNGAEISHSAFAATRDFTRYRAISDLNLMVDYRDGLPAEDIETRALIDQVIQDRRIDLLSVDFTTVDDMVVSRILQERAAAEGYVIPAEVLDAERESQLTALDLPVAIGAVAPESGDPRPLPERVDEMLAYLGFDRADFESIVTGAVLDRYYTGLARDAVPDASRQVHLRYIAAPTEEAAQSVVTRLAAGEAWDDLAGELSTPERNLVDGGDLGFSPIDLLDPFYTGAAVTLAAGEVSTSIAVGEEFHVLLAVAWEEERPLTANQIGQLQNTAATAFRSEFMEGAAIEYLLGANGIEWADRHGLRNVGELDATLAAAPF
jgi:parvulin-like peptidyl-prolyl isomerase